MRSRWIAVVVAVLAIATTGCGGPSEDSQPLPRPAGAAAMIIDADPQGAILLDGRDKTFLGIRRDGSVAWRSPIDPQAPVAVRCLVRCPDAVLSGSAVSVNSPTVADPEPVLMVDGQRRALRGVGGTKRHVLTAAGPDDFVLATGDGAGRWWLEMRRAKALVRVTVGGFYTSWQESTDGHHALAITAVAGGGNEARWFARRDGAWRQVGVSTAVAGVTSCVRPDGERALLVGQRPVVLDYGGREAPITDLEQAGMCAWAADGGIVADLAQGSAGAQSQLRVFDAAGRVTWQRSVPGEAIIIADPSAPLVAYTALDVLHEIDPRSGTERRAIRGVRAARYDGGGDLVVVWSNGDVAWLPTISAGGQ